MAATVESAAGAAMVRVLQAMTALAGVAEDLDRGHTQLARSVLTADDELVRMLFDELATAQREFLRAISPKASDPDEAESDLIERARDNEACRLVDLLEHDRRSYNAAIGAVRSA
jgi:hypothetical protein